MTHGKKLVQILTGLCCRKHRHWGLLAAKQSEPVIMLCMETMRMSNADMNRGFCHILWPQNLIQVVWGDPAMLCNYIYAGMTELWRHQFVLKYMPCSVNVFWKLPPSNQLKIIWNKSLLVCPHSTPTSQLETIFYHILREKAWLCPEAKAVLWHIVFL